MRSYSTIMCMMAFVAAIGMLAQNAQAGDTYYSNEDPGTVKPPEWDDPPPPPDPWIKVVGPIEYPENVGEKIWLGRDNSQYYEYKDWTITFTGADYNKFGVSATHGYTAGPPITEITSIVTGVFDDDANQKRTITVRFIPQPDWEVIEITRSAPLRSGERAVLTTISDSDCYNFSTDDTETRVDEGFFGNEGDGLQITEVWIFPEISEVDALGAHAFTAPPATGDWTQEIVYTDPDGNPRPQGGVRWWSNGAGLAELDIYSLTLVTVEPPMEDENYSYYAYDDARGDFVFFRMGTIPTVIPAASGWGLALMGLLAVVVGVVVVRRLRASEAKPA